MRRRLLKEKMHRRQKDREKNRRRQRGVPLHTSHPTGVESRAKVGKRRVTCAVQPLSLTPLTAFDCVDCIHCIHPTPLFFFLPLDPLFRFRASFSPSSPHFFIPCQLAMSAADVILRLLANSSDSSKGRRRRRSRYAGNQSINQSNNHSVTYFQGQVAHTH